MVKLNLGSGVHAFAGWVNVDKFCTEEGIRGGKGWYKNAIWEDGAEFVQADILKLPFKDNYADVAEMHEVIEHFPIRDVIPALKEIYRVLKPGAKLIGNCPSFNGLALDWLELTLWNDWGIDEYVSVAETLFGNQAGEGEFHRCPFNYRFLNYCLASAGFTKGDIYTYKKGGKLPQVGGLGTSNPKGVLRNDILVFEVIK